jgi:hypothetical protein
VSRAACCVGVGCKTESGKCGIERENNPQAWERFGIRVLINSFKVVV